MPQPGAQAAAGQKRPPAGREEIAIEVLPAVGRYRGRITVADRGRLLEYQTRHYRLDGRGRAKRALIRPLNTEQVFAIGPVEDEWGLFEGDKSTNGTCRCG